MRIVSWNCNGGYRKKHPTVVALQPDLLLLQEVSRRDAFAIDAPFTHWIGANPHRGLAVIAASPFPCRIHQSFRSDLPWFLPLEVGPLRILAIWASVATPALRYVRLVHLALDHYEKFLSTGPAVAIGDFNSNTVFDRKHGKATHTRMVERFDRLGLVSAWHAQVGEEHGSETSPTFFLYRHTDKPFHLDYAFVSCNLQHDARLEIGAASQWLPLSDHLPLILDLPDT